MKRRFSETNLNSSSDTFSIYIIPNPNTTTLTESNPLLSGTQVAGHYTDNSHSLYEGLDPTTSENIACCLRGEIFENVKKTFQMS